MSTHSVSPLDSGRLLQCIGILTLAFAGITSFEPFYCLICTIPLTIAGIVLLLLPRSSRFHKLLSALDTGDKSIPPGPIPNRRQKKASEKRVEREKQKQAIRESAPVQRIKGQPSEAQIEQIKKEQDRRLQGGR